MMDYIVKIGVAIIVNVMFHAVMWVSYRQEKKIATAYELRQYLFTWKICGIWMFLNLYAQLLAV